MISNKKYSRVVVGNILSYPTLTWITLWLVLSLIGITTFSNFIMLMVGGILYMMYCTAYKLFIGD